MLSQTLSTFRQVSLEMMQCNQNIKCMSVKYIACCAIPETQFLDLTSHQQEGHNSQKEIPLGIEPRTAGLQDQRSTTEQQNLNLSNYVPIATNKITRTSNLSWTNNVRYGVDNASKLVNHNDQALKMQKSVYHKIQCYTDFILVKNICHFYQLDLSFFVSLVKRCW